MRIPPYYKRPGWQRFFAGVIIGMIIGWTFFIYNFGMVHEKLVTEIKKQQSTIEAQMKTIDVLRSDQKKLNEENEKRLTIQDIEIYFTNERNMKITELTVYELKQQALGELEFIKNKDIATIAKTRDLMIKTIENKVFLVEDNKFQLKLAELYLYTTLELYMKIEKVN